MIAAYGDLDTNYLLCRDLGHPWEYKGHDGRGSHLLYCPRCETDRVREIDGRGFSVGNRYRNRPQGYSVKGIGWDANARAAMRSVLYGERLH